MTVSKINRVFTLAATAVLAVIILSASSTDAAPFPPSAVDGALAKVGETGGSIAGKALPQNVVASALNGHDDMMGVEEEHYPVYDEFGNIIWYTMGKEGTRILPEALVIPGAEAARDAAGLN
ncbi:hypothetical protein BGZ97_000866 [Linnemannia gamsii]|uniref:Uncharacterized protein n=1 Tax=Linnemannia gamsii TaxID=64522 RepID=A0A9P6R035_9FUNG|nr:hypothetical protein BGZ97_000866 [Linnemannia gamsii]